MYIGRALLDILFPPTAHQLLLRDKPVTILCPLLEPHMFQNHHYLVPYHHPLVQAAIAGLKFEHTTRNAALLAAVVSLWLSTKSPQTTYLVSIPLSAKRERERGYNQVTEVLTRVSTPSFPSQTIPNLLYRTHHTERQTSLHKSERIKNMHAVFVVNKRIVRRIPSGSRIIICDDVCTTGATLQAARDALEPHLPPTTTLLTLAWAH